MMAKYNGDRLGFLLILKMEIVNGFLTDGRLSANLFKDAIACILKTSESLTRTACKCPPLKKALYDILPVIGSHCLLAALE